MKYLLVIAALVSIVLASDISTIEEVNRKFNLELKSVVELITEIKVKPESKDAKYFYHVIPHDYESYLVDIEATYLSNGNKLKVEKLNQAPQQFVQLANKNHSSSDFTFFRIELEELPEKHKFFVFELKEIYKKRIEPFPAKIAIKEDQYVRFEDNKYFLSLYPVKKQTSQFTVDTRGLLQSTEDETVEKKNRQVKYGPYKDLAPLSYQFLRIHFQKNQALPIFTEATRVIEISHWGNINVDEHFEIFNEGAGVKGEWGRVDYNMYNPNDGKNAIKNLKTQLPRYIRGLYYYDFIGNISSSNAFRDQDKVDFSIDPRFPIFGQWKTDWNQGYNMPTKYHLFYDMMNQENYVFNFTFLHNYNDILAENYTLKVILPEGATNIKAHIPFAVDKQETGLHFSTLDYIGRPVVIIHKNNAISSLHNQHFQVSYTFSSSALYIEPLYVIVVVFVIFLAAIYFARFDMHFDDKKVKVKED